VYIKIKIVEFYAKVLPLQHAIRKYPWSPINTGQGYPTHLVNAKERKTNFTLHKTEK